MRHLVVTKFAGNVHFALDHVGAPPRQKDERWKEIDRVPCPDGMTLVEAVALWRSNRLKRPEPPPAKERVEKRDRSWVVQHEKGPFPSNLPSVEELRRQERVEP